MTIIFSKKTKIVLSKNKIISILFILFLFFTTNIQANNSNNKYLADKSTTISKTQIKKQNKIKLYHKNPWKSINFKDIIIWLLVALLFLILISLLLAPLALIVLLLTGVIAVNFSWIALTLLSVLIAYFVINDFIFFIAFFIIIIFSVDRLLNRKNLNT